MKAYKASDGKELGYGLTLVHENNHPGLSGREVAERWVALQWNGEREIESWTDSRFSLVYGVSVYEIRLVGSTWRIYRHDAVTVEE